MPNKRNGRYPTYSYVDYPDEFESGVDTLPGINTLEGLHGLAGGADWQQVQEDVSHELEGRIALVGMPGAGKCSLVSA